MRTLLVFSLPLFLACCGPSTPPTSTASPNQQTTGASDEDAEATSEPPKKKSPEELMCGGIAGRLCSDGLECVDNPYDYCYPDKGGADCPGMCVEPGTSEAPKPVSEPSDTL